MSQRVLVTGAASGIGLGIAEEFRKGGAEVFLCDAREDLFDDAMKARFRGCFQADIGKKEDVSAMFEAIRAAVDGLDVLVNNVGIAGPHAAVEDIPLADWEHTIRTNLSGTFMCIAEAVPGMKDQGNGTIINISSCGTQTLPPMRSVYNTSKWAVEGLTRSLARELAPRNIRCNAILPGVMNNARMRGIMERRAVAEGRDVESIEADYLRFCAMGRLIEVDEIGQTAVFLASNGARSITGQLLSVCGFTMYEE